MKGFLFGGDPHLASKRPGRRKDDYTAKALGKLEQAVRIANERDLLLVILGDLFHLATESSNALQVRLLRILRQAKYRPKCSGGNHDKEGTLLADTDALTLITEAGGLEVFDGETQLVGQFETSAGQVSLWMTPYGAEIPNTIEAAAGETVVLVTHHDLAFQGAYPGAAPLKQIAGCHMVVNGHMHKTTPSVPIGATVWHNPGNITRLSVDCIDHVPSVWAWEFGASVSELEQIALVYERDCFDMTGLQVAAASSKHAVQALQLAPADVPMVAVGASHFAELISAQSTLEANRMEDSESFLQALKEDLAHVQAPTLVQELLLELALKAA